MYHHKRHFSLTLLACRATLALVLAFCLPVFSLQAARVTVEFKEQQTTHQSNEIASNMLKVVNGSDKMLNFFLNLNLPAGWSSTKSKNNLYSLEAGDSLFIPVKLMFNGHEEGDVNNLITASLLSEKEKFNEFVLISLRTMWGLDTNKMKSEFGIDATENFIRKTEEHVLGGFLEMKNGIVFLTREGKLFADSIAGELFL